MKKILGVDIGGSGIKAAPVDLAVGSLLEERKRIETPDPATPDACVEVIRELVEHFAWDGPVGIGVPAVVRRGTVLTAANLHEAWVGFDAAARIADALGQPVTVINDADAAGLAEVTFGSAAGVEGTVIMVTLGTGIGTAVFNDAVLLPNTEFGHLDMDGVGAEDLASARVKADEDLSWRKWSTRLDAFLEELERLLWPDLFVIGGGISKEFDHFCDCLDLDTRVVPAQLRNEAGIVGAGFAGRHLIENR